jgi:hypothetical protein
MRSGVCNQQINHDTGRFSCLDIQALSLGTTGWTRIKACVTIAALPRIDLTSTELMDVARALKLLARQAQADAEKQGGSSSRLLFEECAKGHLKLAADFESAWRAEQQRVG